MQQLSRREFALTLGTALAVRGQGSEDLTSLTLTEASGRIRARSITATQLTDACLSRIETYNPKLNAFITVMREQALAQARDLDSEQRG